MKRIIILALFIIPGLGLIAQAPPPPPPDPSNGGSNGPVGGPLNAPIDGGLTVFLAFAAAMSSREWIKGNHRNKRV